MAKGTVAVKFVGDTKDLEGAVDGAGSKLEAFGKIGIAAGAAIATAAIGAGVALFKVGSDFDDAYDKIRVTTGKTGEALGGLEDSFRNVVKTVPTDFGSASDAIATLNQRLGLTGGDLEATAKQVLNLSRITGTDLAANLDAVTGLFNNWGITVDDQGERLDELFRASQATGIGVDVLAGQMSSAGVQLRALGMSFDDSTALLAGLAKAGLDASDVMPALGKAMASAAANGEDAQWVFEETFRKIRDSPNDVAAAQRALEVFGAKAGPKLAAMIREGTLSLEDLQAQIVNGSDTINDAAADTDDFGEKWTLFKNNVLLALEPVATRVFDLIGDAMANLLAWWTTNGPAIEAVALSLKEKVVAAFDTIKAGVDAVVSFVSGLLARFRQDHDDTATAVGEATSRIGEILGTLRDTFMSMFEAIKVIVTVAVTVLTEMWDRFGRGLVDNLRAAFGFIFEIVNGAMTILGGFFDLIKAILTGKWGDAWDAIKQILSGAWESIKGIIGLQIEAVRIVIETVMGTISGAWSTTWNGLKTFVSDIWEGIKTAVGAAAEWVRNKIDSLLGPLDEIIGKIAQLPDTGGGGAARFYPDAQANGGSIPKMAAGGIVTRPTLALIGEAGPEAVVPLNRLGGSGGGGMQFNGPIIVVANDPDEFGRKMRQRVRAS